MDERKRGEERFDNREKTRGMEKMSKKRQKDRKREGEYEWKLKIS